MRHWHRSTFLLRPGWRSSASRLQQFRLDHFRLLLILFSVEGVLKRSLFVFDRDLTAAVLADLDVPTM
jgi:hypothetical protein